MTDDTRQAFLDLCEAFLPPTVTMEERQRHLARLRDSLVQDIDLARDLTLRAIERADEQC
jgi:hypothetical protein